MPSPAHQAVSAAFDRTRMVLLIAGVQVLFFRDPANWTYPARFFMRATLRAGDLPIWNPLQGLGFPTLGNPLYGLFYPPNWLFLIIPESLVVHMVTWQSLAHLMWGGIGMAALLARLLPADTGALSGPRPVRVAAFVAAMAFCLSGYTSAQWT